MPDYKSAQNPTIILKADTPRLVLNMHRFEFCLQVAGLQAHATTENYNVLQFFSLNPLIELFQLKVLQFI